MLRKLLVAALLPAAPLVISLAPVVASHAAPVADCQSACPYILYHA